MRTMSGLRVYQSLVDVERRRNGGRRGVRGYKGRKGIRGGREGDREGGMEGIGFKDI